jgi:hypothetical protein
MNTKEATYQDVEKDWDMHLSSMIDRLQNACIQAFPFDEVDLSSVMTESEAIVFIGRIMNAFDMSGSIKTSKVVMKKDAA